MKTILAALALCAVAAATQHPIGVMSHANTPLRTAPLNTHVDPHAQQQRINKAPPQMPYLSVRNLFHRHQRTEPQPTGHHNAPMHTVNNNNNNNNNNLRPPTAHSLRSTSAEPQKPRNRSSASVRQIVLNALRQKHIPPPPPPPPESQKRPPNGHKHGPVHNDRHEFAHNAPRHQLGPDTTAMMYNNDHVQKNGGDGHGHDHVASHEMDMEQHRHGEEDNEGVVGGVADQMRAVGHEDQGDGHGVHGQGHEDQGEGEEEDEENGQQEQQEQSQGGDEEEENEKQGDSDDEEEEQGDKEESE